MRVKVGLQQTPHGCTAPLWPSLSAVAGRQWLGSESRYSIWEIERGGDTPGEQQVQQAPTSKQGTSKQGTVEKSVEKATTVKRITHTHLECW